MSQPLLTAPPSSPGRVIYPDSDGEPMAENTVQYDWIVRIKSNLDHLLPGFVAGDLFWYPVEGDPTIRVAPDVLVATSRPKGPRSSYLQWEEGGPPDVVFEVWSPGNSFADQIRKLRFYEQHGVMEFITIRPETGDVAVFVRRGGSLEPTAVEGWTSPLLGIRLEGTGDALKIVGPDGRAFRSEAELTAAAARADEEAARAEAEAARADAAAARADEEAARAVAAAARAEKLAAQLRALGIEPEAKG